MWKDNFSGKHLFILRQFLRKSFRKYTYRYQKIENYIWFKQLKAGSWILVSQYFLFFFRFQSGKVVVPSLSSVLTVEMALEKKSPTQVDLGRSYKISYAYKTFRNWSRFQQIPKFWGCQFLGVMLGTLLEFEKWCLINWKLFIGQL